MKRLFGLLLIISSSLTAGPVITYFFKEFPMTKARAEEVSKKFCRANSIARCTLEGLTRHYPVSGIFSTYFGFLQVSNANGQTTFPRKQSNPALKVIVTNKITPIVMFANTISHWELETGTPAAIYNFELKTDEQTQLIYWDVKRAPSPEGNKIPSLNSIIIIAKPRHVYVPKGITLAKEDANLILPDMYIKKGINTNRNALYMLNLASFFRPVDMLFQKDKLSVDSLVEEY